MGSYYSDLDTNFPDEIDAPDRLRDITAEEASVVSEINELLAAGNIDY